MKFSHKMGSLCTAAILALSVVLALAGTAFALPAPVETFDFRTPLAPAKTAGAWYPDRMAPAGFAKALFDGDNRLKLSIAAADYDSVTAYNNTQGRDYDLPNVAVVSADLYVPADWASTTVQHRADLWATAVDGVGEIDGWPIIGYLGGTGFRAWDPATADWHAIADPAGFAFDKWYNLKIELDPTGKTTKFYIDGVEVYSSDSTADPDWMAKAVGFSNVMLQGQNFGADYDVFFDNVVPVAPAVGNTITFETNGGSAIAPLMQDSGTAVTAPVDPTKLGNTFAGWFSDVDLTTPYVFDTMPASDITLYAKWTVNSYTLTFNSNGGSAVTAITQDFGSAVTAPADPTKVGSTFAGWFGDAGLTAPYVFSTMPGADTTVYAKWTLNAVPMPVFRFYNMKTGAHFYTQSPAERDQIVSKYSLTFRYEGVAFTVDAADPANSLPLYRFYNVKTGAHFYTASEAEKTAVIAKFSKVYRFEGVAFNVCAASAPGATPVYRFYNLKKGVHFFTASAAEKDQVATKLSSTYRSEGVGFYFCPVVAAD